MSVETPEAVLAFWLDETPIERWYKSDEAFDRQIIERFEETWIAAAEGGLGLWLTYPAGTLAFLIVTDQFSRNMFRGQAKAFATDGLARAAAKAAIQRDWDLRIDQPARQFFYTPLMHSEHISDQDHAVRLYCSRLESANSLLHAKVHRAIIRDFGRFPYRNEALGRTSTAEEQRFIEEGGYGELVRKIEAEQVSA